MTTFDAAAWLFAFAALIGIANDRWFHLPRNIALLLGALTVASGVMAVDTWLIQGEGLPYWRNRIEHANLSGLLLDGVLALLLFAGSMHVDLRELRDRAWPVALLATVGVVVTTGLFGVGFHLLTGLFGPPVPLIWCLVLGVILAPTDAVVVEGLLRQVRMPNALRGTISGESLFNDGAAVVLFLAALAIADGQQNVIGHGRLALKILEEVVLGGLLGWLGGYAVVTVCRTLKDRSLEVIVSLALALGIYRLAAAIGVSGPIAVVAAGLAFRHLPRRSPTCTGPRTHPKARPKAGLIPTGRNNDPQAVQIPSWRPEGRHPRLASLQPRKAVDAGLRRHDGEELTGVSIFPSVGMSSDGAFPGIGARFDSAAHPSPNTMASWEVIDDLLNTLLFMLMGFQLLAVTMVSAVAILLPLGFLLAVVARAISVCPAMMLLRLPVADRLRGVGVLTWTGLRGGISIALVLTLPETPHRDLLLAVGYGVVIATIVLQGLTVPLVLRALYRRAAGKTAAQPP